MQKQIAIFTFLTKYVGAALAEWKVKKGERERKWPVHSLSNPYHLMGLGSSSAHQRLHKSTSKLHIPTDWN